MLALAKKSDGGRPAKNQSNDTTSSAPTLADMGITKFQSASWQALASMTEEHFNEKVEESKQVKGQVTTAFLLREFKPAKKAHGRPKKGKRAEIQREELKAAKDRGVSMLCSYARLLIGAIQAWQPLLAEAVTRNKAKRGLKPP